MKQLQAKTIRLNRKLLSCALASCLAMAAGGALAQSTGATLRGQVTADSAAASGASVTATNTQTGFTRTVQSGANGGYNLAGLPPGSYKIDVTAAGKTTSKTVTLQVGQTATLNLGVGGMAETATAPGATTLDTVTVVAAPLTETKTSEIATYISNKQIESLPQGSRNFLAFADIVPGVEFKTGSEGSTSLRSGAQSSSGINVFVDGVGQKDYILKGGVTGQDSSRGNPFPQLGISEYKVITSNYKAEYDQLSSAAITAVTRSGTNDFHGDVFFDRTSGDWTAKSYREELGVSKKPRTKEEQYGFSFGGPIIKDKMHFFLTYEAKDFTTPRSLVPGRNIPISALPQQFRDDAAATTAAPFQEDLFFGKIDWSPDENNLIELTVKRRKEDELTSIGGIRTNTSGTFKTGEETRTDLRWQYSADNWLNDAHLTFEDTTFGPRPVSDAIGYHLQIPRIGEEDNTENPGMDDILWTGGGGDFQDKGQKGYSLQNDFTFFGLEGHTIKAGIKYKSIDLTAMERQPFSPQFFFDGFQNLAVPYKVEFTGSGLGFPPAVESSNKQFGIYLQDDWDVTDRLQLNLGLRWDYEKIPSYEDHVTPADLAATLQAYAPVHQPGVDYNINNYISNGSNRKSAKDQWQPRLGFSYDLTGDERHVIFGGAGRSYSRNQFDYVSFEQYRLAFQRYAFQFNTPGHDCTNTSPDSCIPFDPRYFDPAELDALARATGRRGEVFLLNNDLKTPYSDQFSIGMRNSFGMWGHDWNSSVTVLRIESHDGILFSIGNRREDGSFFPPGVTFGNSPGADLPVYGRFFRGDNAVETTLNSLLLSLDKPFTNDSKWGVTIAYTFSDAEENRYRSDIFTFDYPNLDNVAFTDALDVAKHRLVATGIAEIWGGLTLSGKLTLASPIARDSLNCLTTAPNCFFDPFYADTTIGFKQFDLALQKEWEIEGDFKWRMRGDLLNAFDWRNFDSYNGDRASINYRQLNQDPSTLYPTRTFKFSMGFSW